MKTKKVLKAIGIIVAVIIILLLIHTFRNYYIITDLQNKNLDYSKLTNYYIKTTASESDGTIVTTKYYRKDNNQVAFLERNLNGEKTKISIYNNGEKTDVFIETKDSKIAQLNSETIINQYVFNLLETDSNWQIFLGSFFANVKSTDYNNKECYVINNFVFLNAINYDNTEAYIEKDTGLLVKMSLNGIDTKREYEFGNVEDTIFIEPDISQYTVK